MTSPAAAPESAGSRRQARRRLILALALIGLAVGSLGVFERFRQPERDPPAPHEPAQALIAPPPVPVPAEKSAAEESAGRPPPPVVVNETDWVAAPTPPRAPRPSSNAAYVVQAGVFASSANAQALRKRLEKEGIRAQVETRVQLGPYQDRGDAEKALTRLRRLGVDAVMVPVR